MVNREEFTWSGLWFRAALNTASHPIEYAKVLIQIGHEPIPPRATTTFFGKPALALPNMFQYIAYIKSVDGFIGCYRGVLPKLCANTISGITFHRASEYLEKKIPDLGKAEKANRNAEDGLVEGGNVDDESTEDENMDLTEEERRQLYLRQVLRDMLSRTAAIFASQPFHVIAVRMMAQFVGGETKYSGILSSVREVYVENGLGGFFRGLVPRIVGEVASLFIASTITYTVNAYIVENKELQASTSAIASFLAGAITYPFQLVCNCMAVSGSGLVAGAPPQMPLYTSWVNCWSHLSSTRQLKRGSTLLWRYYSGPHVVIQGRPIVLQKDFK